MSRRKLSRVLAASLALVAVVGLVALAVLLVGRPAPTPALPGFANANVLLVTLDTTRADRLGCYGYAGAETPVLDELARDGVLFEQAASPTGFTLPSHSSILTGLYPPYHGVRLNGGAALADVHVTLAERLAEHGYRCGAFIGAMVLDGRWGLGQGFDRYDDEFELGPDQRFNLAKVQRPGDRVVDAALGWLGEEGDRPFFAWVHLYDPHTPYEPPEPFRSRFDPGGPSPPSAGESPSADSQMARLREWLRRQSALYDGEIAFTDAQVGRLLDWLDAQGLADDTIVVVVGDHGEGLGSHGETEHGYFIYDFAVRVPFLIRLPAGDLRDVRVPAQVRTVDILPTVLALVGVDPPEAVHGESLVPLMADPDREGPGYAYSESMAPSLQYGWSPLYGVRTADYKFIEAPRGELYDLGQDPGEADNVITRLPGVAEELRGVLARIREEIEAGAPEPQQADLDEQTLAMLASLGYVGGASAAREGEDLADPKDTLHLYNMIGIATQLFSNDDHAGAARQLEMALEEDPGIPQARLLLATSYRKLGRTGDAKEILDAYLREDPDSVQALIAMAGILSEEGNTEEVLAICRRALAVDERSTQAYELMAGVYMAVDDHQGALLLLQKVVEIQPKLTRSRNNLAASLIGVGELDRAEQLLGDIVAEFPKFPLAHFHLGLLYEERGRLDDARKAYAAEVEHYPKLVPARFNLGNLLLRLGDTAAAEEHMRMLIEEDPALPRPYLLLSRILLKTTENLGEVQSLALAGLERTQAAELKALGYFLLADVYSRQGRQAELQEVLDKAQYFRAQIDSG
jgi:arylsulfatase A-like enzyme/thioredoxin-like negative regulator of GroEL